MIVTDIEERIRTMGLKQAYYFLTSEEDVPKNILELARFGRLIPRIDVYDYFNGTLVLKSKKGEVLHRGKKFNVEDVYTDMEMRLVAIKKFLLKIYGGAGGIAKSR